MNAKKYFLIPVLFLVLTGQNLTAQPILLKQVREYTADLNFPTDLCGNKQGDVFVLDGMNDRVVVIKKNGTISYIKPLQETFYKAVGLSFIDGALWVADTPRSRLIKLEMNGRVSEVIALDHGVQPVDLTAIGTSIAVTDRRNHSVTVIDENRKEKYHWGKRGGAMGEFINPAFIAAGPENRLIIGDVLNRRVVSYSQSGRYPQIIAKPGVEMGQIFRPKGVAVDTSNQIWIADGYTGAIQLFTVSGNYVGIASTEPGKPLALQSPMGIWFDDGGRLWVVEAFGNKVSLWELK